MKRFVTYLYLYDGRIKGNNAGFIKVDVSIWASYFRILKCISRTDKKSRKILRKRKSVSGI